MIWAIDLGPGPDLTLLSSSSNLSTYSSARAPRTEGCDDDYDEASADDDGASDDDYEEREHDDDEVQDDGSEDEYEEQVGESAVRLMKSSSEKRGDGTRALFAAESMADEQATGTKEKVTRLKRGIYTERDSFIAGHTTTTTCTPPAGQNSNSTPLCHELDAVSHVLWWDLLCTKPVWISLLKPHVW